MYGTCGSATLQPKSLSDVGAPSRTVACPRKSCSIIFAPQQLEIWAETVQLCPSRSPLVRVQ